MKVAGRGECDNAAATPPGVRGVAPEMRPLAVGAFVAVALIVGYGSAVVVDGVLRVEPVFAAVAVALVGAGFGWWARGRDSVAVIGGAWFVAYAGYLGLALERAPYQPYVSMAGWLPATPTPFASLALQWPVILLAGIPFALVLVVVAALPFALIPVRRSVDSHANDALWRFVEEHNARSCS